MTPFHHLDPATPPADAALIWPWRPNWATLPVERLEWRTAVHVSQNSAEQRRALRPEPRLQMAYSYLLAEDDAPVALGLMRAWQGKVWAAPAWWAASKLTAGAPTDTLALSRATETLWQAGSRGMVYTSAGTLEPFTVASVTTNGLVLTAALAGTWPVGATVVPLHFADLPAGQSATAPAGELLRLDVTFEVRPGLTPVLAEPADGSAWGDTFPTGTPATDPRDHLLGLEHNWTEEAKLTVTFPNDVNDPGLGLLSKRPAGARSAMQWSVRLLLEGDAAVAQLRQFVAAHRARAVGFYALNPVLDTDATSISAGTATMPSLRFYSNPGNYVAGLSYLKPKYRPQTLMFEMPGPAATDITGAHTITTAGTVTSGVTFGSNGRASISPAVSLTGNEWHLWFSSSRGGALSVGGSGSTIQAINVFSGSPDTDVRRLLVDNAYAGGATLVNGTVAAGDVIRLSVTNSGATLSLYANDVLLDTATGSGFGFNLDALAATSTDSLQQYLNATLYDVVAGVGPLTVVGYERISLGATVSGTTIDTTGSDTLDPMLRPRLVSPVRLASDSIEITHHSLGVAEVVLPLTTT